MADFAKLTHVASEVEGNMLVGRLKDAGLQAFVQPSVSPVQESRIPVSWEWRLLAQMFVLLQSAWKRRKAC